MNVRVAVDDRLHLLGKDLVTSHIDHGFSASHNGNIPILIHYSLVPAQKPITTENILCTHRGIKVTGKHPRSPECELTNYALFHLNKTIVQYGNFVTWEGTGQGGRFPDWIFKVHERDATLNNTIRLADWNTELLIKIQGCP